MYPASSLATGTPGYDEYVITDLPDAVTVNGVSRSRSGSGYGNTTDGVIWENGVWAVYTSGVRTTRSCLITGDGKYTPGNDTVEDQFDAQYTLKLSTFAESFTVTRRSLCSWYYYEPYTTADGVEGWTEALLWYDVAGWICDGTIWYIETDGTPMINYYDRDWKPVGAEALEMEAQFEGSWYADSQKSPVGYYLGMSTVTAL